MEAEEEDDEVSRVSFFPFVTTQITGSKAK
jgi:hypothetical protein